MKWKSFGLSFVLLVPPLLQGGELKHAPKNYKWHIVITSSAEGVAGQVEATASDPVETVVVKNGDTLKIVSRFQDKTVKESWVSGRFILSKNPRNPAGDPVIETSMEPLQNTEIEEIYPDFPECLWIQDASLNVEKVEEAKTTDFRVVNPNSKVVEKQLTISNETGLPIRMILEGKIYDYSYKPSSIVLKLPQGFADYLDKMKKKAAVEQGGMR
jgi:hypothetical protein